MVRNGSLVATWYIVVQKHYHTYWYTEDVYQHKLFYNLLQFKIGQLLNLVMIKKKKHNEDNEIKEKNHTINCFLEACVCIKSYGMELPYWEEFYTKINKRMVWNKHVLGGKNLKI